VVEGVPLDGRRLLPQRLAVASPPANMATCRLVKPEFVPKETAVCISTSLMAIWAAGIKLFDCTFMICLIRRET
jgi:hypothetical protein